MERTRLFALALVIATALSCTPRLTNYRRGWSNCAVGKDNSISCTGRLMAQVECYQPHGESCSALAVRYADGQRVMLTGTVLFPDDQPPQVEADEEVAFSPEIAEDGSTLWFSRGGEGPRAGWKTYEPETGEIRNVDRTSILLLQRRLQEWLPLWRSAASAVTAAPAQ